MLRTLATVLFLMGCATSIPAYAAEDVESEAPLYAPTSGWLVGTASLMPPKKGQKAQACVMANQFDNGIGFRFSGRNKAIKAMAVDFRQTIFKKGERRDVELSIGEDFDETLSGIAYDTGTLVFSVQDYDSDLHEALSEAKTMTLNVAGHSMDFALIGVREGLDRMAECNGGKKKNTDDDRMAMMDEGEEGLDDSPRDREKTMEEEYAPAPMRRIDLTPVKKEEIVPDSSKKTAQKSKKSSATGAKDSALPEVKPDAEKAEVAAEKTEKSARVTKMSRTEGGSDSILDGMLERAQKALDPDPGGLGLKESRMIEPAAGEPDKPVVASGVPMGVSKADGNIRSTSRDVMISKPVAPNAPKVASVASPDRRWRAMKGASLREVLDVWAVNSNARVVWKTSQDYSVKRSASVQGSFESAVDGLLGQYGEESGRPVARLFNDPATGEKVLVVSSESVDQ